MHRDQAAARRDRWPGGVAAGFVLLALVGEWAGHAATWYLTGGATPGRALSGTLHTYLGPVGVIIAVLALGASWLVWRGLRQLVDAARSFESSLRRVWRIDRRRAALDGEVPIATGFDVGELTFAHLWAALAAVQLVVYLVQENVESSVAGRGLPGLHALTAHHGSALAVHAAVALLGAALAVEVADRWRVRSRAVTVAASAYRALTRRRTTESAPAPGPLATAATPLVLVGRSILSRPPPSLLSR